MALAPNRTRAKHSLFSSFADEIYPEGDPQKSVTEEPDEDAGDEQDGAAIGRGRCRDDRTRKKLRWAIQANSPMQNHRALAACATNSYP